jgi:MFS transporter, DHA1 family, inner membrane transport protein
MESSSLIGMRVDSCNSALQVGVMTSLMTIGPLSFAIMPVLMIGLAERFHWSEAKCGLLATIELGALALASISGLYWQRRWNWRRLAIAATLLIVVANLAATQVSGFAGLAGARFTAGAGSGILLALYFAFLPSTRNPDRNGSIATFAQVVTQVGSFYVSSWILRRWGLNGLYVLIAIISSVLLPFARWIPSGTIQARDCATERLKKVGRTFSNRLPGLAGLLANAFFFAALTGIFAFFGEFGQGVARLGDKQIVDAIAFAAALGLLGPVASYLLSRRFGFLWPILGSALGLMLVLILLAYGGYAYLGFLMLIALLLILWNFSQPYGWALMVVVDEGLTVAVPGAQTVGIALGPAIVGFGIQGAGIAGGAWLALSMMIIYLILIMPLCVMSRGSDYIEAPRPRGVDGTRTARQG